MAGGTGNRTSIARRGLMFVLSSPSGAGKTTLSRMLLKADRNVELSVSVTTRPRRPGEVEGRDYRFIDLARFEAMVKRNELLEWAEVFGYREGSRRSGQRLHPAADNQGIAPQAAAPRPGQPRDHCFAHGQGCG